MKLFRALKLAMSYSKAKRLLRKNSTDIDKLRECANNLHNLIAILEEDKQEFVEEIKKIKSIVSELTNKIAKEIK